jgi:hypothetical protein
VRPAPPAHETVNRAPSSIGFIGLEKRFSAASRLAPRRRRGFCRALFDMTELHARAAVDFALAARAGPGHESTFCAGRPDALAQRERPRAQFSLT